MAANMDIHLLRGQAENEDPIMVLVSARVDPVARRRIRTGIIIGILSWESCAPLWYSDQDTRTSR